MNEAEIRAKLKRYNTIITPFTIAGVGGFLTIPLIMATGLLVFWITLGIGVISVIIAAVYGSKIAHLQQELEDVSGVTAERERTEAKVREERNDKFLHGLDKNNAITEPRPPLSDAELAARIRELTPKIKIYNTIWKIFTAVTIIGIIPLSFVFPQLGLVPFIPVVIFGMKELSLMKELKCIIGNSIIRGVLSDTFELTNYSPGCHLAHDAIVDTKLIASWNKVGGSDLIEGKYRGVRFSFSDLLLQNESGSGKNRSVTTRFKGQWLIIELAKEIPHKVMLREDGGFSDVKTENVEFNEKFRITAADPHTAFFVLTPHFMEHILRAGRRAGAKVNMCFFGTRAHIALHSGRDLFEASGKKFYEMSNIEMLRNQMQWDVKYITGIIDELLLNENLFGVVK